ncbi:hypothetical protein ACWC9U_35420 [Streptomyces sp. 900116325]
MKRLNPKTVPEGQSELFAVWRHHVIFTDSRIELAQAEPMHREHACVEQVFADLEDSVFGHLPSGQWPPPLTTSPASPTISPPPSTRGRGPPPDSACSLDQRASPISP